MTQISQILFAAHGKQLMVPRFQRGWVWKRKQVRQLFWSLYHKHPVGSLITWPTLLDGRQVENVIDGQQRLTALYGIIRGERPPWLQDEVGGELENLMFNVDTGDFEYATSQMYDDPMWTDITSLYTDGLSSWANNYRLRTSTDPQPTHYERIARLIGIRDQDINVDKLPSDIEVEAAAEVFKIVNRSGTRVSDGDLVLGQISLKWSDARLTLSDTLEGWREKGYGISLEWLLHAMSASLEGRIDFEVVLSADREDLVRAYELVREKTSEVLNHLQDALGIDKTTSTSINNGLIVVVGDSIMKERGLVKGSADTRKLIGWWFLSTLHDRWSRDVRTRTNKDLGIVASGDGIAGLMQELRTGMNSQLTIGPLGFTRNRSSKSMYRLLQTLTRRRGARDLRTGVNLSFDHFGANARLEAHHIFPRSFLNTASIPRDKVDQLANLALITKGSNLRIGKKSPAEYLPNLEQANPQVLESQWIPQDPRLWTLPKYDRFIAKRCELLSDAANDLMEDLIGQPL